MPSRPVVSSVLFSGAFRLTRQVPVSAFTSGTVRKQRSVQSSAIISGQPLTLVVQRGSSDIASSIAFVPAWPDGHFFQNSGRERLWVNNTTTLSILVTVVSRKLCSHGFLHNSVTRIPGNSNVMVGPFETFRFNDVNGRIFVTYSATNNILVAVTG